MAFTANLYTKSFELIDASSDFIFIVTSSGVANVFVLIPGKNLVNDSG
jgi:hypothetical protein